MTLACAETYVTIHSSLCRTHEKMVLRKSSLKVTKRMSTRMHVWMCEYQYSNLPFMHFVCVHVYIRMYVSNYVCHACTALICTRSTCMAVSGKSQSFFNRHLYTCTYLCMYVRERAASRANSTRRLETSDTISRVFVYDLDLCCIQYRSSLGRSHA